MGKLTIAKTKDRFLYNSSPFFYLADTAWTALYNPNFKEWEEYLEYRSMQGFNALQMTLLTLLEGGRPDTDIYPFKVSSQNKFDFYVINEEYFKRAQIILSMALEKGFIPAIVVLWSNYVKGTSMSKNDPKNIMPFDIVKPYTEYLVKMFSPYNPIYMISGDTDFLTEHSTLYYLTAMETIKNLCPDALVTFHLGGGLSQLPEDILYSKLYDFYLYQSGHNIENQECAYKLAKAFYEKPVKRPVINGEPCYEGHYFGGKYGRYNEFNVRKAIWQSLLSGAKAGVTYGAHGIWGWYKDSKEVSNECYGGKQMPWRTAMKLKGAWDAAFAKWIFETYDLFDLEPNDAILNDSQEIRMSVSSDSSKVVIYAPYNADLKVNMDLSGYDWTLINLSDKLYAKPVIKIEDNSSVIKMHDFNSDVLIIGVK